MKYEIVNPSDPYTMEHGNFLACAAAIVLLGRGAYPLDPEDDKAPGVPPFLFGGFEEWWAGQSPDLTADEFIEANPGPIAEALESVTLGCAERSSMNNIGGNAEKLAAAFRKREAAERQGVESHE